jgi:PAS domain S-box-containing protein
MINKSRGLDRYVLPMGIGLGILFWIIDAAVMSFIFQEGDWITQVTAPGAQGLWRRGLVLGLMFIFALYTHFMVSERKQTDSELLKSEERYRRLVELSPDAVGIQSEDKIVFMNSAGLRLFGAANLEQLIGKSVWDFVPKEYREVVQLQFRQMREEETTAPFIELKLLRLDGVMIDSEVTATPFEYRDKPGIQAIFRDVTKRKRAEEEIKQRNVELSALNAIAATVSRSLDLDKILNDALDDVLKLEILGDEAHGMIFLRSESNGALSLAVQRGAPENHPCLTTPPEEGECLCGLAIERGEVVLSNDSLHDERHTRAWANMPNHKDICLPLMVRGKVLGGMNIRLPMDKNLSRGVVELLTSVADQVSVAIENARLFKAVDQQHERLRVLGVRLAETEEAERRRLARELHDQVGQNLTALGINLNILKTQIPTDVMDEASTILDETLALVEQTTERIRDVMAELRPPMLDDYGLVATLRWYADQFSSRVGLPVRVSGHEPLIRLTPTTENALFRIATEALTNVAKHAQASQATLSIDVEGGRLRMKIADDGIGFDPAHETGPEEDRGWGLLTMRERAEAVGGRFQIDSRPSHAGTRITVEVEQ